MRSNRGFYGIGIVGCRKIVNVGTLFRSAQAFGANFVFTVGPRYRRQASDTCATTRHVPLFEWDALAGNVPKDTTVVGIECGCDLKTIPLPRFCHPERAIYVLGSENRGIPDDVLSMCHCVIELPTAICLNVATAGSIVMYDRFFKSEK